VFQLNRSRGGTPFILRLVIGQLPPRTIANRGIFLCREVLYADRCNIVVYSKDTEADRTFFKDILGFRSVDAGHGWLIFALPAAEVAFHPHDENNKHEMFFTCDDIKSQVAALQKKGVQVSTISEEQWGTSTTITLPGGGMMGLYEPNHPVTFKTNSAKKKRLARKPKKR
jgi:catechol 2,3-dioxygenase-like lactoylglutathione lyase family enzyme